MKIKSSFYRDGDFDGSRTVIYKCSNRYSDIETTFSALESKIIVKVIRYSSIGKPFEVASDVIEINGEYTHKSRFISGGLDNYSMFRIIFEFIEVSDFQVLDVSLSSENIIAETLIENQILLSNYRDSNNEYTDDDDSEIRSTLNLLINTLDRESVLNIIQQPLFSLINDFDEETFHSPKSIKSKVEGKSTSIIKIGTTENE